MANRIMNHQQGKPTSSSNHLKQLLLQNRRLSPLVRAKDTPKSSPSATQTPLPTPSKHFQRMDLCEIAAQQTQIVQRPRHNQLVATTTLLEATVVAVVEATTIVAAA